MKIYLITNVSPVESLTSQLRQHQYHLATHLALYPIEERAKALTKVEEGIFKRYLEKENGQRTLLNFSTTREKIFLEKRLIHATNEEMLQRLTYVNGVHFSIANQAISVNIHEINKKRLTGTL